MIGNRSSDVDIFLKESLKRLKLSYVDLYLIHAPTGLKRDMKDINNVFPEKENGEMDWDMDTNLPTLWQVVFLCRLIINYLRRCRFDSLPNKYL